MKYFISFFLFSFVTLNAQEGNGVRIILKASKGDLKNSSFYVYDPPFEARAIYRDTTEAVNSFPEQLMSSIVSENSEAWHHYNNLETKDISESIKNRIESKNKDNNYFELLHKFSFNANGQDQAIIRFNLITDNRDPIKGAYSLVKINGKWLKTSTPQTFRMTLMNVFFKTEKLEQVFLRKKSEEPLMNNLLDKVYDDNTLNMDKLLNEFESWSTNNEIDKLNFFTEKPNWKK